MILIKKGLDLPLSGVPATDIESARQPSRVALLGSDYQDMKPTLEVAAGDRVALGQPLFTDKKNPRVIFTAPATGKVIDIYRGDRRAFVSLVIETEGEDEKTFTATAADQLGQLSPSDVVEQLLQAGQWPALRVRPYSKIPDPETRPAAIFVTAIDTNPLAPDPQFAINENKAEFSAGLEILKHLTDGRIHLCKQPDAEISIPQGINASDFSGGHPAGLVGTHIHFLEKVSQERKVWYVGYQDVIAFGYLFLKGRIYTDRLISLGGPGVKNPRLLRTRIGACLSELLDGELHEGENRVVSGSVLSGHHASDDTDFLGRYHNQVSVLQEDRQRRFLGWLMPGFDKFSSKNLFASRFLPPRQMSFTTSTHGSDRAMVPIGAYERVMPLDNQITWLLRSLLTQDTDLAQGLGCLELDEEDLALCSFVCPGKIDYGFHLRQTLQKIEKEG